MTIAAQLFAIFAFGLVISGVVFLGVVRAREVARRIERVRADDPNLGTRRGGAGRSTSV